MSQPYAIINVALGLPVGIPVPLTGANPTKQPVTTTPERQPWIVQKSNGADILRLGPYVTISENDGVWNILSVSGSATEWAVIPRGDGEFVITDPGTGGRGWTLRDPSAQVSLEPLTENGDDVAQLWRLEQLD